MKIIPFQRWRLSYRSAIASSTVIARCQTAEILPLAALPSDVTDAIFSIFKPQDIPVKEEPEAEGL